MYEETKSAVRKAFEVGKILFSLTPSRFDKLVETVSSIVPPSKEELTSHIAEGLTLEDAVITEIKERYKKVAVAAGFTEKQGIAMLEYAAMLEELKEPEND